MRFLSVLCLLTLLLTGCSDSSSYQINGLIDGASELNVYFDKIMSSGNASILSNTKANSAGKFKISSETPWENGIYRVRIGTKNIVLRLDENTKKIDIKGDLASIGKFDYVIEGSAKSADLQQKLKSVSEARQSGQNIDQIILSTDDALSGMLIAQQAYKNPLAKAAIFKSISKKLSDQLPSSTYAKDMSNMVNAMDKQLASQRGRSKFKIGDEAPEIAAEDPNGKVRKLSDLKGKVVLIDFWASWCGPCRKANPHVVEIYNKYKDQGFDVFSYSLDGINPRIKQKLGGDPKKLANAKEQAKNRWKAAIEKDKLAWKNHASELAHWNSKANRDYGVSSIPTTFLVGKDGKFVAINPRYNLEEEVKKALKS